MTPDYTVCPHCGCHCEDPEYCAACGRLFDDELISSSNGSLLDTLESGLRSLLRKSTNGGGRNVHHQQSDEGHLYTLDQDSDLDVDSSWAILSTNIHNRNR